MKYKPDRLSDSQKTPAIAVFLIFLRLGLTSFGGPIAHLGYFREEFVQRRKWLSDHAYADLVALCQFLPGPASSQVGIALGVLRCGFRGALSAWLGFTLPSAVALILFAIALIHISDFASGHWLHGLKVVAVAVVAQALHGMTKNLCPDLARASIAIASAIIASLFPNLYGQIAVILIGGGIGWLWLKPSSILPHIPMIVPYRKTVGFIILSVFFVLLFVLPLIAKVTNAYIVQLIDSFYRSGSLVFGGGHVVLPFLQSEVVTSRWVSNDVFLAGYGVAQAIPGPLFSFAAYLGAVSSQSPNGVLGACIALIAIFLPSFLLILGVLPLWESLRRYAVLQRAMLGINAAVVGLLLAAFYNPVCTSAILSVADFALALVAFLLLVFLRIPSWVVVIFCATSTSLGWY